MPPRPPHRPALAPEERVFKQPVTFPATLWGKVKALARDRKLSEVCREAVEKAEI